MRMQGSLFSHYHCHSHVDLSLSSNLTLLEPKVTWTQNSEPLQVSLSHKKAWISIVDFTEGDKRKEGIYILHLTEKNIYFKQSPFLVVLPWEVSLWPFPSKCSTFMQPLLSCWILTSALLHLTFCLLLYGTIQFWPDSHMESCTHKLRKGLIKAKLCSLLRRQIKLL